MCNGVPNTCVDYIELRFPSYNKVERTCGDLSTLGTLMGFDGMTELDAEIVTNTETERSGLFLNVYCVDPDFDENAIPLYGDKRKKRNVGDGSNCTSPNGRGPRDEPQLPPPVCCNDHVKLHFCPPIFLYSLHAYYMQAARIQEVLLANPSAFYGVLDVMENLSYCDNNLTLSNGTVFPSVTSLLVENRFGVNVFYRVAPGQFGGFGMSHIKLIKTPIIEC